MTREQLVKKIHKANIGDDIGDDIHIRAVNHHKTDLVRVELDGQEIAFEIRADRWGTDYALIAIDGWFDQLGITE